MSWPSRSINTTARLTCLTIWVFFCFFVCLLIWREAERCSHDEKKGADTIIHQKLYTWNTEVRPVPSWPAANRDSSVGTVLLRMPRLCVSELRLFPTASTVIQRCSQSTGLEHLAASKFQNRLFARVTSYHAWIHWAPEKRPSLLQIFAEVNCIGAWLYKLVAEELIVKKKKKCLNLIIW